jgi:glycosyltransferase involved in cell wall biosynthesis
MSRLKVLYLAQHLTMGGAEELLLAIATGLPAERFEVVVGCLTREGLIARELRQAGVRVVCLPGEPGPRDPLAFARLVRFIQIERPDIVHTFLLNAGLYGRLAAWLAHTPAIYHAEQNIYARKSRRHLLLERFLAARTRRVIACCRAVAEYYQRQVGVAPGRLAMIYNAVDFARVEPRADRIAARAELGYDSRDIVFAALGRLTEQKGHDTLIEAIGQLAESHHSLRLFLAGDGFNRQTLEAQVAGLGLAERVRFLGVRRDRSTLYAAMDVFVLPSRWEGLSMAVAEAAGLGIPIVATDVGGNAEVVQGEAGAWLVPPDDPAALSTALAHALAGPGRYERSGVRRRFSLGSHLSALEELYTAARPLPLTA